MVIVGSLPFLSNICAQRPIAEKKKREENHFINPSSVLFLSISWSSSWGESILQMTAVHQWLYQTTISQVTEEKQKRLEKRNSEEKKICKVREKKCQQGSSIRQSDTQLPLSLSLTNSRAVRYKLPCDSVWITLDWEIWMGWRGVKGQRQSPGRLHSIRVKGLSGWQSET